MTQLMIAPAESFQQSVRPSNPPCMDLTGILCVRMSLGPCRVFHAQTAITSRVKGEKKREEDWTERTRERNMKIHFDAFDSSDPVSPLFSFYCKNGRLPATHPSLCGVGVSHGNGRKDFKSGCLEMGNHLHPSYKLLYILHFYRHVSLWLVGRGGGYTFHVVDSLLSGRLHGIEERTHSEKRRDKKMPINK